MKKAKGHQDLQLLAAAVAVLICYSATICQGADGGEKTARLVTIDWDGNMKLSSDQQVVEMLKYVQNNNSTFLYSLSHFTDFGPKGKLMNQQPDDCDDGINAQNQPPYSAIGYLLPAGCTAYLVGRRHLLTAAHCLHSKSNRDIYPASQVTFDLKRTCPSTPGVRYTVKSIQIYEEYLNSGNKEYDFARLLLTTDVDNWLGFAYRYPMPTLSGEVCGYPSNLRSDNQNSHPCFNCSICGSVTRRNYAIKAWPGRWFGVGRRTARTVNINNRLQHNPCEKSGEEGGISGAPAITSDYDDPNKIYSYGVHTHGPMNLAKSGVWFSKTFFYDICNWMCNTGGSCRELC